MKVSAVAPSTPSFGQNLQIKIPLWRRIAMLVTAVVATIFSLGFALCSTRVLNWYKESWSGYPADKLAKKVFNANLENKQGKATLPPAESLQQTQLATGALPLIDAVKNDRTDDVVKLIKSGADVNATDKDGNTALHFARNRAVVEMLLVRSHQLLNQANVIGNTPLMLAAKEDRKKVVDVLIEKGAIIDVKNENGNTALHNAKSAEVIGKLLDKAPQLIESLNAANTTPLFIAVLTDGQGAVKELIARGAKVDLKDKFGNTPLHYAKSAQVIEMLAAQAPQLLDSIDKNDHTPLMRAVCKNDRNLVEALLRVGAQAGTKDKKGNTALHLAKSAPVIKMLLEEDEEDPELLMAKNERGETPLLAAAANNCLEVFEELLANEETVIDEIDKFGNTALHLAKSAPVVQKMLKVAPGLLEQKNGKGRTPLMRAAWAGNLEAVNELLKSGAKADEKNSEGDTALHLTDKASIIEALLVAAPQLLDAKNAKGNDPLVEATLNGKEELIKAMLKGKEKVAS